MMKVLHVRPDDAEPIKHIASLLQEYSDRGIEIEIQGTVKGIDIKRFDLVHGHYALNKKTIRAYLKSRTNNVPFILHCHGSDVRLVTHEGGKSLALHHRTISGWMRKRAEKVILSTPDLLEWSAGLYVPNPVDIEKFRPLDVEKKDRELLFGRFKRDGGLLYFLNTEKEYDCVNWGDEIEFPENVNELEFQSHSDLPEFFNQYKRMIGSLKDPVSLARLEAMACGLETYTDFPEKYTTFYGLENPDEVEDPRKFVKRFHHPERVASIVSSIYREVV